MILLVTNYASLGIEGPEGIEGAKGNEGAEGDKGANGLEGVNALSGAVGDMGAVGVKGLPEKQDSTAIINICYLKYRSVTNTILTRY